MPLTCEPGRCASTIAKIQNAGFVSINVITRELSEREIPTPKGGKWHPTSVKRLLQRLKRLEASSPTGVSPGEYR